MPFEGHIQNGVVVFDERVTVPEGAAVRVELIAPPRKTPAAEDSGCFQELATIRPLDATTKDSLRTLLTREQYEALVEVVDQGGPDVDAIRRLRAASMT
jgi:hypothetical protein